MRSPRRFTHLSIDQVSKLQQINQIRDLRQCPRVQKSLTQDEVEISFIQRHDANGQSLETQQGGSGGCETDEESNASGGSRVPGSEFRASRSFQVRVAQHELLVKALQDFLCVPIHSTCELAQWLETPLLRYYDKSDNDYRRAVSTLTRSLQHLDIHDIWELVNRPDCVPNWYARTPDHYLDETASLNIVERLLDTQYPVLSDKINFLQKLYDICEKRLNKMNTLFVIGPANCGKSFFFDMVTAYYLNPGHLANFVRGEHFPLNDCVGRRIIMWNEPNLMPSAYDTLKMVAAGDPCPANVKYQGHSTIARTPLIMTGNRDIVPESPVWQSRVIKERWINSPCLAMITGYPNPKTYYRILLKYGIIKTRP